MKNYQQNELKPWHTYNVDDLLSELGTSAHDGISVKEAERRLVEYGPNELIAAETTSAFTLVFNQFKNVLILILLGASILSGVLGHGIEAIAIAVIVLFAVVLGFVQEYKAEKAIEALKKMAAPTATVVRGGQEIEIPAAQLVPGDIFIITTGDKIPADARLVEAINLKIEEAALTGESVPVEKNTNILTLKDLPVGDRKNIVYSGTAVTYGRGRAVVVATGMHSEFGKIAKLLQSVENSQTPLQKNLDKLGKTLAKAALVVVLIIVALGVVRGQPFLEMLIFGIALAVAVVPEALPAVVTVSLAIGVQRMVKRHALVRRLPAVETLGATSIICSDKTGTLTKDEMTVRKVMIPGYEILDVSGTGYEPKGNFLLKNSDFAPNNQLLDLLHGAVLCSDVRSIQNEGVWDIKGDPTEGALVVVARKVGIIKDAVDAQFPRIAEIPFSSETKRMTTLNTFPDGFRSYSKGAVEIILNSCVSYMSEQGIKPLDQEAKEKILKIAQTLAEDALRVIAVSSNHNTTLANAEKEMIFLGLFGMIDPPRAEAKTAVETCKKAGIKITMITGDHPITARAIAQELGILLPAGKVVTGVEVDAMSDEDLEKEIEDIDVFARVSPAHKLRVVDLLQKQGHVVAMTGDGVNDAPALKKADIGIAMGIAGTDVTKEASAMMLTNDNFASIVSAVEEGRIIFDNIKKYLMYLLSSNIGEIGLMVGASVLGLPLPLTAVQILYVNLATDGLPALALAVDPPDDDIMQRPPRRLKWGIFSRPVVALMLVGGMWSTLINLGLFYWASHSGRSMVEAMTMVFVSLVLVQFFKAFNFRSDHKSVLNKPFANTWLNRAVLWELVLLVFIIYVPFLQKAFSTYSLSLIDWIVIATAALTVSPVLEITKRVINKRNDVQI